MLRDPSEVLYERTQRVKPPLKGCLNNAMEWKANPEGSFWQIQV